MNDDDDDGDELSFESILVMINTICSRSQLYIPSIA